jgi:hypothetical protein
MKGLLAVLAKAAPGADKAASEDTTAPVGEDGGFEDAAAQLMDCLKNNDVPGFAEALKACIQMGDSDEPA